MQITHQADYAIRTVFYLARLNPDQKVSTRQIAKDYQIPPSFLTKIVSQLSIAGLIHTTRGASGGVSLAHPPEKITMLEVLEAVDGPIALNDCVNDPESCPFSKNCVLHHFWSDATDELVARLKSTTFDQLVANGSLIL